MGRILENNQVTLSGEIAENFQFNHEGYGEKFYTTHVLVQRKSGFIDSVPIMVSERLVNVGADWIGQIVKVAGRFQSYNKYQEGKSRLILFVFVDDFMNWTDDGEEAIPDNENKIVLEGYICKQPIYRVTPLGREISDFLLAVNRNYNKTDYIPCIAWNRNARYVSHMHIGQKLHIEGRIQSREYQEKLDDESYEKRTAYEVSVSRLHELEEM